MSKNNWKCFHFTLVKNISSLLCCEENHLVNCGFALLSIDQFVNNSQTNCIFMLNCFKQLLLTHQNKVTQNTTSYFNNHICICFAFLLFPLRKCCWNYLVSNIFKFLLYWNSKQIVQQMWLIILPLFYLPKIFIVPFCNVC